MMHADTETAVVDWRSHIIDSYEGIRRVIDATRRIAVLGMKLGDHRPAFFVPEYAQRAGYEIVPVPVYYPDETEMLGEKVYRQGSRYPSARLIETVTGSPPDHRPLVRALREKYEALYAI